MISLFIRLISIALNGENTNNTSLSNIDADKMFSLAKRHGVISTIYCGAEDIGDSMSAVSEKFRSSYYSEIRYDILQQTELQRIQSAFESNGINNIALKGSNTKHRYPETVLRSMGDIDILIKPSQNSLIKSILTSIGFTSFSEGRKHDHYNKQSISVEIHRDLLSTDSDYYSYYADIWKRCKPKPGCNYTYEMTIEDEYIFNILHLVEHFKNGGVGIRFIMDVYVYRNLNHMNVNYIAKEIEKLELTEFEQNIVDLADLWFSPSSSNKDSLSEEKRKKLRLLGKYIINGGTFGSSENAKNLVGAKGKGKYLLSNLFPSYKSMVSMYPWLSRSPILLPVTWMIRGLTAIIYRRGNIKSIVSKAKSNNTSRAKRIRAFYESYGVKL